MFRVYFAMILVNKGKSQDLNLEPLLPCSTFHGDDYTSIIYQAPVGFWASIFFKSSPDDSNL